MAVETRTPTQPIYRVARHLDAWQLPDWSRAKDGTFGNRFDDPESEYRVLYASSQQVSCFVETLARFRPDLSLIEELREIEGDDDFLPIGEVPLNWCANRVIGTASSAGNYADVYGVEWIALLRRRLASVCLRLGYPDLDAAAPNNPVVLTRAGGHSSVGNSKALEAADINKATPDPPRGLIERDANGVPNGVIRERSDLYTRLVPKDKPADVRASLLQNVRDQLKLGITSVIEAGSQVDPNVVGSYAEWELLYQKHGTELPRASVQVGYPSPQGQAKLGAMRLKEFGKKTGDGNDRLRVGSIGEMPADGGFTGPTAWCLVDYKGLPGFRGRAFFTPEQIHANIEEGHKLGWQFGIHAIGDAAIAMTVDALDQVLHDYPRNDHRHYLCHFTVMPPARTMEIMAKDKIHIAQQPNFTYNLEGRYVETLEGNRLQTNNSITTPVKKYGLFMAFGSDNLPIGPMVGLYAAVTRKGESGKVYGPGEAVSMKEAITMYTRHGAFLTREEKIKGTLETGKVADMIVLPEDLLAVSPEKVLNMKVDMTIVGGKVLYERA